MTIEQQGSYLGDQKPIRCTTAIKKQVLELLSTLQSIEHVLLSSRTEKAG